MDGRFNSGIFSRIISSPTDSLAPSTIRNLSLFECLPDILRKAIKGTSTKYPTTILTIYKHFNELLKRPKGWSEPLFHRPGPRFGDPVHNGQPQILTVGTTLPKTWQADSEKLCRLHTNWRIVYTVLLVASVPAAVETILRYKLWRPERIGVPDDPLATRKRHEQRGVVYESLRLVDKRLVRQLVS